MYSQYLTGERFLPNNQDGQQLLKESVYVEQQAYDTLTSADNEQLLSDDPRNGGSEQQLLSDKPRKGRSESNKPRNGGSEQQRSSNSPMDQRFADNPPNLSEWMIAFVTKNTRKNTKWALTNFNAWRQHYNRVHVNVCPDLEGIQDKRELCRWLTCLF